MRNMSGLQRLWVVCTTIVFLLSFFLALYGANLYPYTPRPFGDLVITIHNILVNALFDHGFSSDIWLALFDSVPRTFFFGLTTWLVFIAGRWVYKGFSRSEQ